jgi:uncharacterized protein (DUF1778 family)
VADPDERETQQIEFRVKPSIKRLIQKAARDRGTSVAGFLKTLATDFLRKYGYLKRD